MSVKEQIQTTNYYLTAWRMAHSIRWACVCVMKPKYPPNTQTPPLHAHFSHPSVLEANEPHGRSVGRRPFLAAATAAVVVRTIFANANQPKLSSSSSLHNTSVSVRCLFPPTSSIIHPTIRHLNNTKTQTKYWVRWMDVAWWDDGRTGRMGGEEEFSLLAFLLFTFFSLFCLLQHQHTFTYIHISFSHSHIIIIWYWNSKTEKLIRKFFIFSLNSQKELMARKKCKKVIFAKKN